MEQQNKMGTAKMGPLIFSMALPAMISMIINALYNIVDSIFVAKYSQDALAAVSPYIRCRCWSGDRCRHRRGRKLTHCAPSG